MTKRIANQDIIDKAVIDSAARRHLGFGELDHSDFEDACRALREALGRDWDRRAPYINDERMDKIIAAAREQGLNVT